MTYTSKTLKILEYIKNVYNFVKIQDHYPAHVVSQVKIAQ